MWIVAPPTAGDRFPVMSTGLGYTTSPGQLSVSAVLAGGALWAGSGVGSGVGLGPGVGIGAGMLPRSEARNVRTGTRLGAGVPSGIPPNPTGSLLPWIALPSCASSARIWLAKRRMV